MKLQLQIVGAALIALGCAHACFPSYFGWKRELAPVSLFTRQVFYVHCFFIALVLVLQGLCSMLYADALLQHSELSRALLSGLLFFWGCRLLFQFFVYDHSLWSGKPFETRMHVAFSLFWVFVVATYAQALRMVW